MGRIDTRLPFGLRSAPIIFTAVTDTLEWCIRAQEVKYIRHYLDDFITVGSPGSMECAANLAVTLVPVLDWEFPYVASDKSEGPSTCITFLGIEVDTQKMELRGTEGEATEGKNSGPTVAGAKSSQAARLRISNGTSATCGESGSFWSQFCLAHYTTDGISQEQRLFR